MELLFTVNNKNTKEEFIKFNRAILNNEFHNKRRIAIVNVIFGIMIVFCLSSEPIIINWSILILVIIPIYFNWKATIGTDRKAAKAFELNKINKNMEVRACLFNDHYEMTAQTGTSNIAYSNLYKIIETNTNLYLMHSKVQGDILVKSNCPPELIEFIHAIKSKYKL